MNILFYSTNSNHFDQDTYFITTYPSWKNSWIEFCNNHKEHNFFAVTQKPGMFLSDNDEDKTIPADNIKFLDTDSTEETVEFICSLKPDIAIALSFWVTPFDWLMVKDALIAEQLNKKGIKTICHSVDTTMICFDKFKTQVFLEKNNFIVPKSIYVQHDLYFCAGNRTEIKYNVYKEAVLSQIKNMHFPLIAKSNVGLSSYGIQILRTFGEACNYLNSKKNNSDRLIQEYIDGEQFGVEIYACDGKYTVFPPFKFSVNQYGVTSPKQSIKKGPEDDEKYNLYELKSELERLSKLLNFNGPSQVDLVFKENKWYIIEINPRLSGMTTTTCGIYDINFYEMIYNFFISKKQMEIKNKLMNFKLPLLTKKQIESVFKHDFVYMLNQTEDKAAKQEREKGYCEVLIKGKSYDDIQNNLNLLVKTAKIDFEINQKL